MAATVGCAVQVVDGEQPRVRQERLQGGQDCRKSRFFRSVRSGSGRHFQIARPVRRKLRGRLGGVGRAGKPPSAAASSTEQPRRDRIIVGTGHRADAPNREAPRFPNTPECISKAKVWLREHLEAEKAETKGSLSGIAGAASGTDLLFHEVCNELGIPTTVVLPIPKEDYRRQSVADGGPDWVERFNRLLDTRPPIILSDSDGLPLWAKSITAYGVFQRGNIWIIEDALLRPNADVTLLALWNGKAGDGPGGTQDMVTLATEHGAKICTENTDELFGLSR